MGTLTKLFKESKMIATVDNYLLFYDEPSCFKKADEIFPIENTVMRVKDENEFLVELVEKQ